MFGLSIDLSKPAQLQPKKQVWKHITKRITNARSYLSFIEHCSDSLFSSATEEVQSFQLVSPLCVLNRQHHSQAAASKESESEIVSPCMRGITFQCGGQFIVTHEVRCISLQSAQHWRTPGHHSFKTARKAAFTSYWITITEFYEIIIGINWIDDKDLFVSTFYISCLSCFIKQVIKTLKM